jgi:hypothetical protein
MAAIRSAASVQAFMAVHADESPAKRGGERYALDQLSVVRGEQFPRVSSTPYPVGRWVRRWRTVGSYPEVIETQELMADHLDAVSSHAAILSVPVGVLRMS